MTIVKQTPTILNLPELDQQFKPIAIYNHAYKEEVLNSKNIERIKIALERTNGLVAVFETIIFGEQENREEDNLRFIERLIKTLLWVKGGWKITIGGPKYLTKYIQSIYCIGGKREFDAHFVKRVFEKELVITNCSYETCPEENDESNTVGKNLDGYRIGFDAGGSDRKVSAVVNGKAIFSEEVVWYPKLQEDPTYQYEGIMDSIKRAATKMPRVDAIGVSAAGVYIDNKIMAASLFIKVPEEVFDKKVKNMFFDIQREMGGIPIEVANDGDVTALAGAMSLKTNQVLGIAMGTSEAAGYVDKKGNITGWLNELAFAPIDYSLKAMEDEWSGDIGCGVKYFSQDGVIKLAIKAGIIMDESLAPAKKLIIVQELMKQNDIKARKVYEGIGCYLGYSLAYYAEFYDMKHVLLMGRVTSGEGGNIIVNKANKVLQEEFPKLAATFKLSLPDENSRRVGQSVAAASLPIINKKIHFQT